MYLKIYLFNWTNPEAINDPNVKPNFVQMGPYVFLEKHQRVNLTWNETADTVSYFQKRTWHFVPELSNGDLSDKVTQIDVMSAASIYCVISRNFSRRYSPSLFLLFHLSYYTIFHLRFIYTGDSI